MGENNKFPKRAGDVDRGDSTEVRPGTTKPRTSWQDLSHQLGHLGVAGYGLQIAHPADQPRVDPQHARALGHATLRGSCEPADPPPDRPNRPPAASRDAGR